MIIPFLYHTLYMYQSIELSKPFIVVSKRNIFCWMHVFIWSLYYMACHWGFEKPTLHLFQTQRKWESIKCMTSSQDRDSCTLSWEEWCTCSYLWRLSCVIIGKSSFFVVPIFVIQLEKQFYLHCFSMQLYGMDDHGHQQLQMHLCIHS